LVLREGNSIFFKADAVDSEKFRPCGPGVDICPWVPVTAPALNGTC
jgi:hypothetical protein